MLLIQHINLHWDKKCRGAPYSTSRNRLQKAYELPLSFFDYNPIGYHMQYIFLQQTKDGIQEKINRVDTLTEYDNLQVGATEIINQGHNYEVRYRYDLHQAIPARQKYDPQISLYKPLNERAMNLKQGEYGRVIYNGRFSSYDSYWYYHLDIINIFNSPSDKTQHDVFIANEPDKIFKQVKFLI